MTLLCLSGGFGNILFQLNYFYEYRSVFSGLCIEGYSIRNVRRLRSINSPHHYKYLQDLSLLHLVDTRIANLLDLLCFKISHESSRPFNNMHCNNYLEGFQISPSVDIFRTYGQYRVPVSSELLSILKDRIIAPRTHLASIAKEYDYVCHVRGGDLARNTNLSSFYSRLSLPSSATILIVTDSIPYAKKIFRHKASCNFLTSTSLYDDFTIMSYASNLIISNSTFAWWAAEVSDSSSIIQPQYHGLGNHFQPCSNHSRLSL